MKLSGEKWTRPDRTLRAAAAAALFFALPVLAAQSQSNQKESLGEAARKARQQKKPATKPVKVLTEDDLARPPVTPVPSVQNAQASEAQIPGEAPAAKEEQAPPGETRAAEPGGKLEEQRAKLEADMKEAKQQLAEAEKQLNLAQREFDLRRDQYYSNPDFKSDKQGKAQLDSLQQEVSFRQQEVERLKDKVSALEAEGKSLPGAPSPAEKPAESPQP